MYSYALLEKNCYYLIQETEESPVSLIKVHLETEQCMYVSKYQDAKNWAQKVIDDAEAGHSLNPSYPAIFKELAQDKYDIKKIYGKWNFMEIMPMRPPRHLRNGLIMDILTDLRRQMALLPEMRPHI